MCFAFQPSFRVVNLASIIHAKKTISFSEFTKSRLMNKDGRFRKDDQYVFYLLWQKEMRELAAGVYNFLKGMHFQLGSSWTEFQGPTMPI